jgi:hypothetical protein
MGIPFDYVANSIGLRRNITGDPYLGIFFMKASQDVRQDVFPRCGAAPDNQMPVDIPF